MFSTAVPCTPLGAKRPVTPPRGRQEVHHNHVHFHVHGNGKLVFLNLGTYQDHRRPRSRSSGRCTATQRDDPWCVSEDEDK